MTTSQITHTFSINIRAFATAIRKATVHMERLGAAASGRPVRPLPRLMFDGTAREYRAARRKYARTVRAHRKAGK